MKRWTAILLCWGLLLTGCKSTLPKLESFPPRETGAATQAPQKQPEIIKQVLMLYMVGSDLESETGLGSRDIEEILCSDICFDNMTVYLCTGGSSYWWTADISPQRTEVFQVTADGLSPVYTMQNKNMAQAQTLSEFLDYCYRAQKAQYYSLILWNHGGGAVLGFGADENYGYDALTLQEMDEAIGNAALIRDGKQFEWVGFDACLMGMIEVADMLSDYAGYMIASEEVETGSGWDYRCLGVLSREEQPTGSVCAKTIIDAYQKYQESASLGVPDYTLSALDLAKTDEVVTALEALVDAAWETLLQGGYSKIAQSRNRSKSFGKVSSYGIYDTVDLFDLSEKLMEMYPQEASALQNAVKTLVVCHASNIRSSHGVAVYFPYENKKDARQWLEVYEQVAVSPAYLRFIKSFYATLSGESLAQWDVEETVPLESEEQPGTYQLSLTTEQMENYAHASFSVWEEEVAGSYICWLISRDVSLGENGVLRSQFQGKRFYVGDSSGVSLPCHASEIERNEEYVKYSIPVLVVPNGCDAMFGMKLTYIHIRVDATHPEGQILGFYREMRADSNHFPNRNLLQISEGDIVIPFLYGRQIVTLEDGSLAPFAQWKSTSGSGDDFTVQGEFTVTMKASEKDVPYRYLFVITDTQGNQYFTDTTSVTQ